LRLDQHNGGEERVTRIWTQWKVGVRGKSKKIFIFCQKYFIPQKEITCIENNCWGEGTRGGVRRASRSRVPRRRSAARSARWASSRYRNCSRRSRTPAPSAGPGPPLDRGGADPREGKGEGRGAWADLDHLPNMEVWWAEGEGAHGNP